MTYKDSFTIKDCNTNKDIPKGQGESSTQGQYLRRKSSSDIITKLFFGILFGYYAIYLTDGGADAIIWASLQIGIYLIFGVTQMMQSYMFIKSECNARTLRKIDELQKFINRYELAEA